MKQTWVAVSVGLSCFVACTTADEGDFEYGKGGSGGASGSANSGGISQGGMAARGGAATRGGSGGDRTDTGGTGEVGGEGPGGGDSEGGGDGDGGTSFGGASSGGTTIGGGGTSDGGSSSTGGASSGGKSSGGTSAGGTSSGGKSAGGASTGGTSTGGKSTGGASTGGKSTTGGASTGGSGTGGAVTNGCTNSPCLNGATCTAGSGTSYTCTCTNRFVGTRCEVQKFIPVTMRPTALSADGTVVVGAACTADRLNCPPVKMASTGGAITMLSFPTSLPAGYDLSEGCEAHAINGNGSWIGAQCYGTQGWSAIEWKSSNTAVFFAGRNSSELVGDLAGASLDASVVVGSLYAVASPADRWFRRIPTSGIVPMSQNPMDLDGPTAARATSNDGTVVVGTAGYHAVRWEAAFSTRALAEITDQEGSPVIYYLAVDVSGDGSVMVGFQSTRGGPLALRWNSVSTLQSLGAGRAYATNIDGSVIVGQTTTEPNAACLWNNSVTPKRIIDVIGTNPDAAGWNLTNAVAVSDNGKVIVGTGSNASGTPMGWVLHLP